MKFNFNFANLAAKPAVVRLQCGFLFVIHTRCTKIVKRLALLHAWLQGKSNRSRWEFMKLVTLHLTFPVFTFSQLAFKIGYLAIERRLFLQTGERNNSSIHKLCVNLTDCGDKLVVIGKAVRRLGDLKGGFSAGNGGRDLGVHDLTPNDGNTLPADSKRSVAVGRSGSLPGSASTVLAMNSPLFRCDSRFLHDPGPSNCLSLD